MTQRGMMYTLPQRRVAPSGATTTRQYRSAATGKLARTEAEAAQFARHDERVKQRKEEQRRERVRSLVGFRNLGEMAVAVMRQSRDNITDSRLKPVPPMLARGASISAHSITNGSQITRAPSGASITAPDTGGFLVPTGFSEELLGILYDEESQLAALCRRLPTTNLSDFRIPGIDEQSRADGSRLGGVLATPLAEGVTIPASLPRFRMLSFDAKKYAVLIWGVNELAEDVSALGDHLLRCASQELGFWLDKDIISGPGAGRLLGITNAPGTITVSKDQNQTATTVSLGNVMNMSARLPPRSRRSASTVWIAHADCKLQFAQLNFSVGATPMAPAAHVYVPKGVSGSPFDLLDGFPVLYCEQAAPMGTKGDLLLADLSHYLLLDGGVKPAVSMHYAFLTDQSVFRFVARLDGQPEFMTPVTAYSGSNTQSAFVAVETRGA